MFDLWSPGSIWIGDHSRAVKGDEDSPDDSVGGADLVRLVNGESHLDVEGFSGRRYWGVSVAGFLVQAT